MVHTRQREAILGVLREAGRPLTRSEILKFGRRRIERLGSATVDRTIREMTQDFMVVGVHFPGQPKRYELPADAEHPHFICRVCDRVYDLPVMMRLPEIQAPQDFKVTGGEVIYSGICADCAKSNRKA